MFLGALVGGVVLLAVNMEMRWLTYIGAAFVFATVLVFVRNQERFLWGVFILAFQFDVSLRFLFGRAGSDGLVFPLPVVVGLLLVSLYLLSGNIKSLRPIRWGGELTFPIAAIFGTSLVSLLTTSERFVGAAALLTQFELYLIYLLALNCVRSYQQFDRTLKLLFVVIGIQSVIYYIQSALGITFTLTGEIFDEGDLPRPGGTVSHSPSGFANFILSIMFIVIAQFLIPQAETRRRLYVGSLVALGAGALILTLTRAAWGTFVIGLAWLVIFGYRRGTLSIRKLLFIGGILIAVSAAAIPMIAERLERDPFESSYNERNALMLMAINVIAANPISGVGPGAYAHTYKSYLTLELKKKWQWTVHNHYLLRTAETGIPGGIAFVLLLLMGLRQALRMTYSSNHTVRIAALGWSAGIIAQCFGMYWDMWTLFPTHSIFWFLLGLMGAAEAMEQRERETRINANINLTSR